MANSSQKPAKVKLSTRKPVSDARLLKLWRERVFERAKHKCEYPGCKVASNWLHPHHWVYRRHAMTRYDPDNGLALCATHHVFGECAAHQDPNFKDIILNSEVRSLSWHENLMKKRNETVKNNQAFKEMWLEKLLFT